MIAGISLFIRIAQKAFAPPQKIVPCHDCGTDRHDLDARHCKTCGAALAAPLRRSSRAVRGSAEEEEGG
jgi:voltage-gated potassium channel